MFGAAISMRPVRLSLFIAQRVLLWPFGSFKVVGVVLAFWNFHKYVALPFGFFFALSRLTSWAFCFSGAFIILASCSVCALVVVAMLLQVLSFPDDETICCAANRSGKLPQPFQCRFVHCLLRFLVEPLANLEIGRAHV